MLREKRMPALPRMRSFLSTTSEGSAGSFPDEDTTMAVAAPTVAVGVHGRVRTHEQAGARAVALESDGLRPRSLPALTGVRFVAAAVVLIGHFAPGGLPFSESGTAAVTLFFLLSGFILTYTAPPRLSARAFYVARLARIYPAYMLGLLLVTIPALTGAISPSGICPAPRGAILPDVAMVQSWVLVATPCLNAPAWSVSCEMFFYLLFPLLLPLVRLLPQASLRLGLLLVWLVALALPLAFIVLHPSGVAAAIAFRLIHTFPAARLPDFLYGMLLGHLYVTGTRLPRPGLCALGALCCFALVPAFVFGFGPLQDAMLWPACAVLLLALAQGGGVVSAVLATPAAITLGEASYGLYILHGPVWGGLQHLGAPSPQAGGWPYFLSYAALMIALALLSLRFVETPARRAIRRLLAPGI